MNKRETGAAGEDLAVKFLLRRGYRIIDRNFYARQGEIDIIAKDKKGLAFIEVKTRNTPDLGYPAEAVTPIKTHRIRKTALYYLMKNRLTDTPYRFEVVSILKTSPDRYAIDLLPLEF